jgi:hypothetical protein
MAGGMVMQGRETGEREIEPVRGLSAASPDRNRTRPGRELCARRAWRNAPDMSGRVARERDLQGLTNNTRFLVPGQVQGLIARRIRAAVRDVCLHPLVAGFRRELCATACPRTEGRAGR